ncbi:peptidylprolyl isomerase [Ligilactobacillus apodemi DSM 16634 = JCM 16172]|uniref:Foldase protein PrsA n=1 Tax=Ligilactobacillus apodemi DSM 16634 = JCM 16172 TaxID=1423724 RepID=A0A0R1TX47_9LACO|nr:peptidylprolyl isomerase [Ligilactobacillus apodemi DSM 16634 = JCM 16172]
MDVFYVMKKLLVACASILLTFSLAACSKTVATTSGGKITESEYYSSMKNTTSGKQILQQMILDKILEGKYGDKVTTKAVNKEYNKYKSQYGSSFSTVLSQNGLTASSFKKSIRSNLLLRQAVIANTKITKSQLKKQWKSYEPTITVAQILVSKKSTAKKIIAELEKDGSWKNFKKLAKKYSIDTSTKSSGGKLPSFNNTDTSLDETFKKAAFALKQGKFTTTPVKTSYGYHIIYSIKNPGKGEMSDHIQDLKDQIIEEKMNDSATLQAVISKEFKEGNVSIKDSDLKDILADYLSSSSSTSSSSSKKSSSSSKKSSSSSSSSDASSSSDSSSSDSSSDASSSSEESSSAESASSSADEASSADTTSTASSAE